MTRAIADEPDAVEVELVERRDEVSLLVHADPSDMGRLIGKRGRVIQALRQVSRAAGAAEGDQGLRRRHRVAVAGDRRGAARGRARRPGPRPAGRGHRHAHVGSAASGSTPGAVLYADDRALVVATSRPHQGRWLVRFEGVDDRTAAEALARRGAHRRPLLDAAEGELWVHELVGRTVRDRTGTDLGVVVAVEANPAHDLLVLDDDVLSR